MVVTRFAPHHHPYPKVDVAPAGRSITIISYPGRVPREIQGELYLVYHLLRTLPAADALYRAVSAGAPPSLPINTIYNVIRDYETIPC